MAFRVTSESEEYSELIGLSGLKWRMADPSGQATIPSSMPEISVAEW